LSLASKWFAKSDLLDLLDGDSSKFKLEGDSLMDNSRWSLVYNLIFTELDTDETYQTTYRTGATEWQDECPFEYDEDTIECEEMKRETRTFEVWVKV
jgi:hypothetical protein